MKSVLVLLALLSSSASAEAPAVACPSSRSIAAVTSAEQAIVAAKAAWKSVYDKANWHQVFAPSSVAASEPYSAVLTSGVWFVTGRAGLGKASPIAHVCESDGSVSVSSK
jgi:hypothetical protein